MGAAPFHDAGGKVRLVEAQQPVVAHIPPQLGIFSDDNGAGNIVPGILGQMEQNRQSIQINRFHDHFLAGCQL